MWLSYALMWFYLCFSCLVRVHWFYWTSGFIVFIKYVKCSVIYVLKYFFLFLLLNPSLLGFKLDHLLDHLILQLGSLKLFYLSVYILTVLHFVFFMLHCLQIYWSFILQYQICSYTHPWNFHFLYFIFHA